MLVKIAPITGILLIPGTVKRLETPSVNLLDALPYRTPLIWDVRKVVSATARILMTTPLIV